MRTRAVAESVAIFVVRFAVMAAVLWVAAPLGWYAGVVVNVVLCALALGLVVAAGLWGGLGGLRPRHPAARAWLVPFLVSALLWAAPAGIHSMPPGFGWWAVTMVLVGVNEELFSRVVVLARLRRAFDPRSSAVIGAVLFGLQHLSALALTGRGVVDVLENVVLSAAFGFAYSAFYLRFRWIWPLVVLHAAGDFVMTLAVRPPPDVLIVLQHVALVVVGCLLLRGRRQRPTGR